MKSGSRAVVLGGAAVVALVLVGLSLFVTKDKAHAPDDSGGLIRAVVVVRFAGAPVQKIDIATEFEIRPGATAWVGLQKSIGLNNLTFQDFGGDLGIFITGFYGVKAEGNHFWELTINGKTSDVGVSSYVLKDRDVLEFRYASY